MGILNITPDSFYDGGFYPGISAILDRVEQMITQGAEIIDLGAVSTRPGAAEVPASEEERRLMPVLAEIRKKFPGILLSVDTYRSVVARKAIDLGADMINDISAGRFDRGMIPLVSRERVPYVMMHIQGNPATMQDNPVYQDVVREVYQFFTERIAAATGEGVGDIMVDPGFGFGKTVEHNFQLLARLDRFLTFNRPVVVGLSRKSMINKVLRTRPSEALNGTTVLNTMAVLKGAHILRVHDVKEAAEVVALCREYVANEGHS
ncbi:MAG TPA: dihydropteroate synthase [Bacteroidales bacterium]|nr:dihydropteroate synthase [Bacteroidales bacterium]HNS47496.1 dihydropteroate synthase [Bacteroidales bacterium]